ncbi:MAG: hypothetical protein ABSH13_01075 [Candidatus Acidiferrum sp.]|jgi:hypothetical protein
MSDANRNGTILIEEGTTLPLGLSTKSDAFLPGWRIVKSPDRAALTRGIEGANWNFFYRAGETRATVLGRDSLATLRRAVKRVFAKQEQRNFNSLELTKVVSKRFLGIPFLRVVAHSRQIQESNALVAAKVFVLRQSGALAQAPRSLVPEVDIAK